MANIIYNTFIKSLITNDIDLTKKKTYKVCLLQESFSNIFNSESKEYESSEYNNYTQLSLAGYECKDTGKYTGYVQGGEYISLRKEDLYGTDKTYQYFATNSISWKNVTLVGKNKPRFILLYRESDGSAIACFDIGKKEDVNNEILTIDWGETPVLTINLLGSSASYTIDSHYSDESTNALQNKMITLGLQNYGVAIGEETIKNENNETISIPEELQLSVDTLTRLDDEEIEAMFNDDSSEPIGE